jgi:hypothetical protein
MDQGPATPYGATLQVLRTTIVLRQYPTSTPNHHRATAVPSEYSVRHLSPFLPKNTFIKPKLDIGLSNGRPNRP